VTEPGQGRFERFVDRGAPLLVAASAVLLACFGIADSDFFWHLEHGERMLSERSLVAVDDWSHTAAGTEYSYYSWLAELLAAVIFRIAGLEGVVLVKALLAGVVLILLSATLGARGVTGLRRLSLLIVALVLLRYRFYARPEIFTLLLIPAVDLLCRHWLERSSRRALGAVPLLVLFWANLHPFVIVGLGVIGAHALGGLLEAKLRLRSVEARPGLVLLAACGLSALASLVNPWGLRIYSPVLKLWDSGPIGSLPTREWEPPSWDAFSFFFVVAALATVLVVATLRRAKIADLILLAAGLGLALTSLRSVGLFALMAAPATGRALALICDRVPRAAWTRAARAGALLLQGLALAFVVVTLLSPHASPLHLDESRNYRFGLGLSRDSAPVGATEFLQARGLGGKVWNSWAAGGWIVRCCWPDMLVSIDGRQLPYEEHLRRTLEVGILPRLHELDLEVALVNLEDRSGVVALRGSESYELVYFDDVAAVFVRGDVLQGRDDLRPLRLLQPQAYGLGWLLALAGPDLQEAAGESARATALAPESARAWMYRGLLARRLGEDDEALGHFQRAVELDPTQATHQVNLGVALLNRGEAEAAESRLREATALEPDLALAHFDLALARVDLGRLGPAKRSLERSLRLDSDQARAYLLLAGIARERGRPAEVRAHAERAISLAGGEPEVIGVAEALLREASARE
jgi:tetratricopeptide (TPR) repeat protein